jgi:hypothetical protein
MEENQNSGPSQADSSMSLSDQTAKEENKSISEPSYIQPDNTDIQDPVNQPKPMEVHKHPQHVTHKKKWAEYMLEFLMIFLAVFLGFIAENIREESLERKRGTQYAQLLYDELKKDTSNWKFLLNFKIARGKKIDSLIALMKTSDFQKNATRVYYYHHFTFVNAPFKPSDITIQQLRNTGALRYFKKLKLYNAITKYYSDCNSYFENEALDLKVPTSLASKIFDAGKLMSLTSIPPDIRDAIHEPAKGVTYKLLISDGPILNEYLMYISYIKLSNELSIVLLMEHVGKDQQELMGELRQEFHVN